MYAISDAFRAELQSSNMQVVVSVSTLDGTELAIAGGNVSMDSNRDIGRTVSLELLPTDTASTDDIYRLVSDPSFELIVKRGLMIDGQPELVPLGVFSTDDAELSKSKAGSVKWSGSDRSKKIARNRFIDPYQIAKNTSLATAGQTLLQSRLNGVVVDFSNVTQTISAKVTFDAGAESDPWKSARGLFSDYGYDLRFDGLGIARAFPIADPATESPVFDFGSGETNMVLDGTAKTTLEGVYNGVIVSGEGSDVAAPVRAVVWDEDPTSPTYYLSGFGQVPYFFSSPILTTVDQCRKAANTILARVKGRAQKLSWPAIVNPALEPLDVVSVDFYGTRSILVLDALTIPLEPSAAMAASARETSIV